jgi:hypothetical protein
MMCEKWLKTNLSELHTPATTFMGKTRHHNTLPRIRHVRYVTKTTTRGKKVVKETLQKNNFQSGQSKFYSMPADEPAEGSGDAGSSSWYNPRGKVIN